MYIFMYVSMHAVSCVFTELCGSQMCDDVLVVRVHLDQVGHTHLLEPLVEPLELGDLIEELEVCGRRSRRGRGRLGRSVLLPLAQRIALHQGVVSAAVADVVKGALERAEDGVPVLP